jgi:hypothetical protein
MRGYVGWLLPCGPLVGFDVSRLDELYVAYFGKEKNNTGPGENLPDAPGENP